MMALRVEQAMGKNEDVRVGDTIYHVQTQDLPTKKRVETTVFRGGTVVFSDQCSYAKATGKPDLVERIQKAIAALHARSLARIRKPSDSGVQTLAAVVALPTRLSEPPMPPPEPPAPLPDTRYSVVSVTAVECPWDRAVRGQRRSPGADRAEAVELFEQSLELRKVDPEAARGALRRALELDPKNKVYAANLRRLSL